MRILFTIPHFFNPNGSGKHGSVMPNPQPRIHALTAAVTALRQLFEKRQVIFDFPNRRAVPVAQGHDVDIVICTTRGMHTLDHAPALSGLYRHEATDAEPMLLGFECHAVLRDAIGRYDYYCFLEDDLVLHDPWFFIKLAWFTRQTGQENLLQPYRVEVAPLGPVRRAYLGGQIPRESTARFQNVEENPCLAAKMLDTDIRFHRTTNPHAGCFFLNAEQMAHWSRQPYFLDRDTSFVGPLESAASLGIMRAFRIYKPAPDNASFFEIQHYGTGYLNLIGNGIRLEPAVGNL